MNFYGNTKNKAKQREDFLKAILGLVGFGGFSVIYYVTKSLIASLIITFILFSIAIAVIIVRYLQDIERIKKSGISEIDQMDGRQFEHYLG